MGIRGLTTYISQNAHRFHEEHQLHDCTLVIDGNSLACQLYLHYSECNSAFGGDYDKYAASVAEFFSLLKQCQINPVVILDGGYEARKLKTVSQRMKAKLHNAKTCNPVNQARKSVFPLFMVEVFKQTLQTLEIQFGQANFEADFEIAAIARSLNCPVLSYDSDFYVFDVKYIPFSTLDLTLSKRKCKGSTKYYLNCQVYFVEHFISNFGGLDKSLLPLMATLLGNDYVPSSIFRKFYNHVKLPKSKKMSQQQRRITAIFEWLRKETLESAVIKILNHLRKKDRDYVKKQIELSILGYGDYESDLISHFSLEKLEVSDMTPDSVEIFPCGDDGCNSSDSYEDGSESSDEDSDDSHCLEDIGCDEEEEDLESHVPNTSPSLQLPAVLRDKFRKGELPSFVSDIYHLRIYFCQPQVEDFTLCDSHASSFPILKVVSGLLLSDAINQCSETSICQLTCLSRGMNAKHQKVKIQPTTSLPCLPSFPSISSLPSLSLPVRKNVLYHTLGIIDDKDTKILETFGEEWILFALTVVYWARTVTSPTITNCHLHAIIIGMVALGVVDKKVGRLRHSKEIARQKIEVSNNIGTEVSDEKLPEESGRGGQVAPDISSNSTSRFDGSLENILSDVSDIDCLNAADSLLQFHQIDGKLQSSPRLFSPLINHLFAQLQACLLQVMTLNSILEYPIPPCQVAETFSGSVAYMAFTNFNRRSDVNAYIGTLMMRSPSVHAVYNSLLNRFLSLLPNLPILFRKGKRKGKRRQHKFSSSELSDNDTATPDEEMAVLFDINNKFSILNVP